MRGTVDCYAPLAGAKRAVTSFSVAESSTRRHSAARSICRTSPERTLPGPTSTNNSTPPARRRRIDSSQRTGAVTCCFSPSRTSGCGSDHLRVHIVHQRHLRVFHLGRIQINAQAVLRGLHQGAMEGRADVEHDGALGATPFGQIHGSRHGRGASGDHHLPRRIQIRRGNHFPLRGFAADFLQRRRRPIPESPPWRPGPRARPPACTGRACEPGARRRQAQGARRHQR